jgi:integrase
MNISFTFKKVVKKSLTNKTYQYGYVILNYTNNSKRIEISTKIKCLEKDFIKNSDFPISKNDNEYLLKNEELRILKDTILKIILQIKLEGGKPLTDLVKLKIQQNRKKIDRDNILQTNTKLPLLHVLNNKYLPSLDKGTSYYRSIKYRLGVVESFIINAYNPIMEFEDVDYEFYRKLERSLVDEKKSNATTSKIISQFRQFLLFAKREKYVNDVIVDYNVKLNKGQKYTINTLNELQIIQLYKFQNFNYNSPLNDKYLKYYNDISEKNYIIKDELLGAVKTKERKYTLLEVVKDMFMFSISTSLRWSDCIKLKVDDFNYDDKQFNFIQQKTKNPHSLSENDISKEIWMKYVKNKTKNQFVFPLNCKENIKTRNNYLTKFNKHLKRIGKILTFNNSVNQYQRIGNDIQKLPSMPFHETMSFHMGRRTHINFLVKRGIDISVISKSVGHQSISMTGIYVDNDNLRIKNTFNDLITPEPLEITLVNPNSTTSPIDDDLKSQIEQLKLMKSNGDISETLYEKRVELLLDKYGFN